MAKVPAFAGRWRIVAMDVWDNDFLDEVEEAHISFRAGSDGAIIFGALNADLESAPATARPVPSFPGKARTTGRMPAAVAAQSSNPPAASSATSTST